MNSTSNDFELYYCSLEKHFLYSKVYLDLVGFLYEKKKISHFTSSAKRSHMDKAWLMHT